MTTHPRIPDDVAALICAYALGDVDAEQAALAEQHIAASDDCRRAYEDALETAAALALAAAASEPPAALRERIVAAARAEGAPGAPAARASAPAPARRRRRLAGLFTPSGGFALAGVAAAIVFGARRRLTARLRRHCARPPGGAGLDPLGARRARRPDAADRRR